MWVMSLVTLVSANSFAPWISRKTTQHNPDKSQILSRTINARNPANQLSLVGLGYPIIDDGFRIHPFFGGSLSTGFLPSTDITKTPWPLPSFSIITALMDPTKLGTCWSQVGLTAGRKIRERRIDGTSVCLRSLDIGIPNNHPLKWMDVWWFPTISYM